MSHFCLPQALLKIFQQLHTGLRTTVKLLIPKSIVWTLHTLLTTSYTILPCSCPLQTLWPPVPPPAQCLCISYPIQDLFCQCMPAHLSDISSSFRKLFYVLPESQIPDTCFDSTVQLLFVAFATMIILDLFLQLFNITSLQAINSMRIKDYIWFCLHFILMPSTW